jgi:hypothetical protein
MQAGQNNFYMGDVYGHSVHIKRVGDTHFRIAVTANGIEKLGDIKYNSFAAAEKAVNRGFKTVIKSKE